MQFALGSVDVERIEVSVRNVIITCIGNCLQPVYRQSYFPE